MTADRKTPREWWTSSLSMERTEREAQHTWPKAEWEDIKCFVLKADYDKFEAKLTAALEYVKIMECACVASGGHDWCPKCGLLEILEGKRE